MKSSRMTSGVIRSAERMTYTNVNKVIESDPEMTERYAALAPRFREMKELALLLNARRNEHGSIDFDLPEPVIEFDEEQRMTISRAASATSRIGSSRNSCSPPIAPSPAIC